MIQILTAFLDSYSSTQKSTRWGPHIKFSVDTQDCGTQEINKEERKCFPYFDIALS